MCTSTRSTIPDGACPPIFMESGGIPFRGAAPAEARKIASLDKNRKFVDSESMAVYMNVIKIRSIFVLKMLPESSEARPPRRMERPPLAGNRHGGRARSAGTAFSAQTTSEYRQGRSSVTGRSRKHCFAERNLWATKLHEDANEPNVDTGYLDLCNMRAVLMITSVAALSA